MNYLQEYYNLIRSKQVTVGYYLRLQIENLVRDLDDERYIYDTTEAHKRIRFMETLCLQSKQP